MATQHSATRVDITDTATTNGRVTLFHGSSVVSVVDTVTTIPGSKLVSASEESFLLGPIATDTFSLAPIYND